MSLSRTAPARRQNEARFPVKKMDRQCVTPVIAVTSRGSGLWSAVLLFNSVWIRNALRQRIRFPKGAIAKREGRVGEILDFAERFRAPI